jgi:hypothetical protein
MAGSVAIDPRSTFQPASRAGLLETVPWPARGVVAAVACFVTGLYWDLAWHQSFGHDSFWIPPHVLIYMCGILAGLSCGYMILYTTFGASDAERVATVKVWGFQAPLGAFMAAWGGFVMLAAGAFDNWWHFAYGLDGQLNSLPHWSLWVGVTAVQVGGIVLLGGAMNRASEPVREKLQILFFYLGSSILWLQLLLANHRVIEHSAICYAALSAAAPISLLAMATASRHKWACTIVAGMYMLFVALGVWIWPLFPATPRLGPVYQQVTHLIPTEFPLLVIVPAFLLDVVRARLPQQMNRWLMAAILGPVFLVGMVAAQWPFASFLMSPGARNWFFGAHYLAYFIRPTSHLGSNQFYPGETTRMQFWLVMTGAVGVSILSSRIGLASGGWLRRVRR